MAREDPMDVDTVLTKALQHLKIETEDNKKQLLTAENFDRMRYWKKTIQSELAVLSGEEQKLLLQDLATMLCIWKTTAAGDFGPRTNMLATNFVLLKLCSRRQWPAAMAQLSNKQCKSRQVWHDQNMCWDKHVDPRLPALPSVVIPNLGMGELM